MDGLKITRRDALIAGRGGGSRRCRHHAPGLLPRARRGRWSRRSAASSAKPQVKEGRVTLDLPPLVENGNVVAMSVIVNSPMTKENHVKAIHVFNEKNPQPNVISMQLGPRAGRAQVSTRIRLAASQKLTAIAEMSDGTYWSDTQEVIVTLAACLEDLI